MGVNQSKTHEKRRRKKEVEDEGRERLPGIFSGHKVAIKIVFLFYVEAYFLTFQI